MAPLALHKRAYRLLAHSHHDRAADAADAADAAPGRVAAGEVALPAVYVGDTDLRVRLPALGVPVVCHGHGESCRGTALFDLGIACEKVCGKA